MALLGALLGALLVRVLKESGDRFYGVGIRPTIPVNRTRKGIAAGTD
jgi:hypothetical protein